MIPTTWTWTVESDQASARLGVAVACGDINGDGIDDLVAGAPAYDTASVDVGLVLSCTPTDTPPADPLQPRWRSELPT